MLWLVNGVFSTGRPTSRVADRVQFCARSNSPPGPGPDRWTGWRSIQASEGAHPAYLATTYYVPTRT